MGLLKRLLMALSSGGGVVLEFLKTINIFSDYNLCVLPSEKLVAQPTSICTLSITEIRLVVEPSAIITILNYLGSTYQYPSPTSAYSLSTAVT